MAQSRDASYCQTYLLRGRPTWPKDLRTDADTAKRLMFTILRVSIEKLHREDKPELCRNGSSIVAGRKTRLNWHLIRPRELCRYLPVLA